MVLTLPFAHHIAWRPCCGCTVWMLHIYGGWKHKNKPLPQKHKSGTRMLLPPSTFNGTTVIVNTFLCHTVAPDEIWALVGNEGKWQWNKLCNWGSPHPKKFGWNWRWLSCMIVMVLPSTIQYQTIKMWIQSTTTSFCRIICIQQSNESNNIPVQVLTYDAQKCTLPCDKTWEWASGIVEVETSNIFPTFQTWVLVTLIRFWSHCTVQNKLCMYGVVHCRY